MTAAGWVGAADVLREQRRIVAAWHRNEARIDGWDSACSEVAVAERPAVSESLSLPALRRLLRAYAGSIARINTFQWHEEDKARDPLASDSAIAAIKRTIDVSNQRRVDEIERLDGLLADQLARRRTARRARPLLSSETPGSMVDRLSILVLKIHHSSESLRGATDARARARFKARLRLQKEQQADLGSCFDELMRGILDGTRAFKLYRQFKTYNDPETNAYMRRRSS